MKLAMASKGKYDCLLCRAEFHDETDLLGHLQITHDRMLWMVTKTEKTFKNGSVMATYEGPYWNDKFIKGR